ncbi:hypothetical protein PSTEL_13120 [Paenibacillus stellifer]|uniref:Uncharacterized protein n=1 Tax=Paenibacillus stellifer TaxID=169760 RepID=A0A089LUX2_9BACL|nr:hypothetical protein [Paenibacillus stellifer]AIQ63885.1 hypothetical protein PSTEL_13120 [Paenibacillus stellifer]
MEFNEAQILVLSRLSVGKVPELNEFNSLLEEDTVPAKWQELAAYIYQLEKEGYLKVPSSCFATGGSKHPVYDNNVRVIWFEGMRLTPKGMRTVETDSY